MKKLLVLLPLILITGCAWFSEKPFHKVLVLPETVIYINNDCDGDMGWAKDNVICAWGYEQDGIVIDYYVLGHEIAHILNHIDNEIRNPDEISNISPVVEIE